MPATTESASQGVAANFASACQALLQSFPPEQAEHLARAVIVSVGRDGTHSVFEVDLADPDSPVEVATRDLTVLGAVCEYVASIRARLTRQINQFNGEAS